MTWLPPFKLEAYFSRWEFACAHNLASSDAEPLQLRELLSLATDEQYEAFDRLSLGYTPTYGADALREAIAATYHQVGAGDVVCFAGAQEAIFLAYQVLMEPGDHAVVITPGYQSSYEVPSSVGDVTCVPLDASRGFTLDTQRLIDAITPRTRVMYINFPHNPTGATLSKKQFREIVALCDSRDIYLLSDEVYRGLESAESTRLPQAVDASKIALSINVMSKSYGLAGLRIGWIACRDRRVIRELERAKHYTTICNAAPSELLATIALTHHEDIWDTHRARIAENSRIFADFFASRADLFDFTPPEAGCVAYPAWVGPDNAENMCRSLVDEAGVLVLPPSVFATDLPADPSVPLPVNRFRVGLGRANPEAALGAWADWLV